MSVDKIIKQVEDDLVLCEGKGGWVEMGGPGSGHFRHAGRKGKRGGSAPSKGGSFAGGVSAISLPELGQEYADITLRQETGMDRYGNKVRKYQPNDTVRLTEIEKRFQDADDWTLMDYVNNAYEIQEENI